MELRQLQYFVAVARHGTFTRALEQELGVRPRELGGGAQDSEDLGELLA